MVDYLVHASFENVFFIFRLDCLTAVLSVFSEVGLGGDESGWKTLHVGSSLIEGLNKSYKWNQL